MKPLFRKSLVFVHIITTVGWLGGVVAYLCIAVVGLHAPDKGLITSSVQSMVLIGDDVLIPLSLAAFASGIAVSLVGPWGIVRHWWVTIKLLLTAISVVVLEKHMVAVVLISKAASHDSLSPKTLSNVQNEFIKHPAGGLFILLVASALSVYKPKGLTPYGKSAVVRIHDP